MKKIEADDIFFTKVNLPFGWLGNMSPYPVVFNNQRWLTTEALFQALRFEDDAIREEIRAQKSPMGAKMKAKAHKIKMVLTPMSSQDVENMKMCVKMKINQHSSLKSLLIATGERKIYEDIGNRRGARHLFWGAKNENGFWVGENKMGEIWMNQRLELLLNTRTF